MKKWGMAVGLFALVLLTVACTQTGSNPSATQVEERPEHQAAVELYKRTCLACHGGNLEGRSGPALSRIGETMDEEQLIAVISEGRGFMPAFAKTLEEDQIEGLAAWLASKRQESVQ